MLIPLDHGNLKTSPLPYFCYLQKHYRNYCFLNLLLLMVLLLYLLQLQILAPFSLCALLQFHKVLFGLRVSKFHCCCC